MLTFSRGTLPRQHMISINHLPSTLLRLAVLRKMPFDPTEDFLLGARQGNPGNRKFYQLVSSVAVEYNAASRNDKLIFRHVLVSAFRGGRHSMKGLSAGSSITKHRTQRNAPEKEQSPALRNKAQSLGLQNKACSKIPRKRNVVQNPNHAYPVQFTRLMANRFILPNVPALRKTLNDRKSSEILYWNKLPIQCLHQSMRKSFLSRRGCLFLQSWNSCPTLPTRSNLHKKIPPTRIPISPTKSLSLARQSCIIAEKNKTAFPRTRRPYNPCTMMEVPPSHSFLQNPCD